MAVVVPLRFVKPQEKYAGKIAARPYDVVSYEEAKTIAAENQLSFLRIEKSEIDLPSDVSMDSSEVFQKARLNLERMLEEKYLIRDDMPSFYIYCQKKGKHEQYGIVAGIHVDDYISGRMKKHEFTRSDKELERTRHIAEANAQTGPVFVTYRSRKEINDLTGKLIKNTPEYDFTADDGVSHSVWAVRDRHDMDILIMEFASVNDTYIADGHHRAASAVSVAKDRKENNGSHTGKEPYNYIMSVLFPHDQLRIMDYNRVVRDLHGLSKDEFMERLADTFDIETGYKQKSPPGHREFGMYLNGVWYRLSLKSGTLCPDDAVGALDVSILQNLVLKPILGIDDPRADRRIDFVGGIRGMAELEKLVDSGVHAVAFSLYPTTLDQLMAVADSGQVMPPKSTWFEPKLMSGLFVHLLD
jgi:uncharacterized protein (DUF1015 family)